MANWFQVQFAILWRRVPDPEYGMAKRILFGAQERMIEELWRERCGCAATGAKVYHAPMRRGKAKVYAVRKGKRPGIYYTLIQAEEQVNGFSSAEWRSFRSVKSAMAYMDEGIREEEGTGSTRVAEVFTDGSFFKSPDRAGWGYLILGHADKGTFYRDRTILQQAQGPVSLSRWDEEHYLGARALTNNTGELSAMGNAMKWLLSEIEAGRLGDTEEVTITSDSLYAIQMVRGAWKAKSNKLMIWKLKELKKRLGEKMHVRLRWTKAHTKGETADAFWNDRVDSLAKAGAKSLPMRVIEESGFVLGPAGGDDEDGGVTHTNTVDRIVEVAHDKLKAWQKSRIERERALEIGGGWRSNSDTGAGQNDHRGTEGARQ